MNGAMQASGKRRFIFVLAACVLLLIVFVESVFGGQLGPSLVVATLFGIPGVWLVFLAANCAIRAINKADLFSPLVAFPITYVLWFGFASIVLWDDPNPLPYAYFGLGLICYLAGVWIFWKGTERKAVGEFWHFRNNWHPTAFWALMILLFLLTSVSYLYLIAHIGVPAMSAAAGEQRLEITKYGPTQAVLFTSAWTVIVFMMVYLRQGAKGRLGRLVAPVFLAIISLQLLSLGSRGFLFVGFLTGLLACHYVGPRFKFRHLLAVGFFTFVGLSFYGYLRDESLIQGYVSVGQEDSVFGLLFPLFYAYQYVCSPVVTFRNITQLIPREVPFQHGSLTFGALKTLLPGHHEMADIFFKKIQGHDFVGFGEPATLLGPLYGDFGVIGIALGMFMFGALLARTYRWMLSDPNDFRAVIYAWLAQTALYSLFGALLPYITTLWIPLFWYLLNLVLRERPARRTIIDGI